MIVFNISTSKSKIKPNKLTLLFILSIISGIFSSFVNHGLSLGFWGLYFRYHGLLLQLSLFFFFLLISQGQKINLRTTVIVKLIRISAFVTIGLIFVQAILFFVLNWQIYTFNSRMTAFFGNPNFAGGFLALSFPLVYFSQKRITSITFSSILFFIAILLTQSRGALLAFWLFWLSLSIFYKAKQVLLFSLMVLIVTLWVFPQRISSPFENRQIIWQKAITAWAQKPLFGWGIERFEAGFKASLQPNDYDLRNMRVDKAHNLILEILVTQGVVGLSIWIFLIIEILKLFKRATDTGSNPLFYSFLLFLFLSQLNVININQWIFFYLAAGSAAQPKS